MRSLLFVPGDDPRKLAKGLASGADVLLVDLEDSVRAGAQAGGPEDRLRLPGGGRRRARAAAPLRPRQRALDRADGADLDAVMPAAPDGVMLPKSGSGTDVKLLSSMIAVREAENGLVTGRRASSPSPRKRQARSSTWAPMPAPSRRLAGLTWCGEDLSADLGAEANRLADGTYADPYRLARSLC